MSRSRPGKVLIVAFFFPPSNVVGAKRPARFAAHLPEHGFEPTVLTTDVFRTRPNTTAVDLPPEAIVRARYPDPVGVAVRVARGRSRSPRGPVETPAKDLATRLRTSWVSSLPGLDVLRFPDRALPWFPSAVRAGLGVLGRERFDAILSTSPPPTAHLVAAALHARTGVDWYADLRDLWTGNPNLRRNALWQRAEEALEGRVLSGARGLVTVSEPLAEDLAALHGKKVTVIPNGFEPSGELPAPARPGPGAPFTLVYTGSLYPAHQDPGPLLRAVAALHADTTVSPGQLRVRFVGEGRLIADQVATHGVDPYVELVPWVPQAEAVRLQREASALLLLDWTDPTQRGILTAKVFEYLGARRPILAVGAHRGTAVESLLERCRAGVLETSAAALEARLRAWLSEHRRTGRVAYAPDEEAIAEYGYPRLTARLADLLAGE